MPRLSALRRLGLARALLLGVVLLAVHAPAGAQVVTPALTGQSCAGTRFGSNLGCTSNDFTAVVNFTQPPGGPASCIAGEFINVDIIGTIQSNSPARYDGALFVGESGNDPGLNDTGKSCSLGVFPTSPLPFLQDDGDSCGDFAATSSTSWTVTGARVRCQAVPGSNTLAIPYTLVFDNLKKAGCSAATVTAGTTAKCVSSVSAGLTGVSVLGYIELTKQTVPDGNPQSFAFTSSASGGQTPQWTLGGVATTQTLVDGQTKRIAVPLSATGGSVTLTVAEAATTFWEPGVSISCAAAPGSGANPATVDNSTRTITANLTSANFGATCTITNTKRSRVTIAKTIASRATPTDQFRVSATGGGTLTDDAGAPAAAPVSATTTGAATTAQTTFRSQPGQALTITDAATSGSLANYTSTYTCTNATAGSPTAMPAGTGTTFGLTPAAGDDITCRFTNTAKTAQLTLRKTWQDANVGDAVSVTATGLTPLASVANTANETDAAAPQTVTAGSVIALAESFTTGNASGYSSSLACTGT
ncbi:MAG: hypothetical protein OEW72_08760, partial [Gammaproteobacteria bacterium]|nr:hypothetical protein [Gammaproteobacteria bacterium]